MNPSPWSDAQVLASIAGPLIIFFNFPFYCYMFVMMFSFARSFTLLFSPTPVVGAPTPCHFAER
jgi:hypothetical protein